MKNVLVVFTFMIATSCASDKNFKDKSTDFSKYKTYEFSDQSKQMSGILHEHRELVLSTIDTEMGKLGFTKSSSPDILVHVFVKVDEQSHMHYGPWGFGNQTGNVDIDYVKYEIGTLFINLVDKSTNNLVWSGHRTKTHPLGNSCHIIQIL